MKSQNTSATIRQESAEQVDNLCGSPEVLFEGIRALEIGLECLNLTPSDDPDTLLKKTIQAFAHSEFARTEIIISSVTAAIMRTESQGEALDYCLNVAKAFDRCFVG